MQEQLLHAAEPGRRPAQHFAGVDLRRPKGYASAPTDLPADPKTAAAEGEPCPRCESQDTKFCYYNNYNTSQPRHFCKGCRRYWTKGGTLRSVPVGGGTRKRPSSSSSSSSSSATTNKRQKPTKKRRAAPAAPEPLTTASAVDDAVLTTAPDNDASKMIETTTTPPTDAVSEITTELVVPAAAAAEEDSFTDLLRHGGDDGAAALDLGFSDYTVGGKALGDSYTFEWPPAFDLGACWSGAGFADPDPGVFMNLP
jgi:hypothetical protein